MSKYNNALQSDRFHIQSLRIVIVIITLLCCIFAYGWYSSPKSLTIHQPPDLRSGSTRAWWEVPPSTVYAFGFYIFQQLNRWPEDGEKDYKRNIEKLSPYLTPHCSQFLLKDYEQRRNLSELRDRVRGVYEVLGHGFSQERVIVNSPNDWDVILDLNIDEYYLNNPVKRVSVRYPLRIVRYDVDPELNPWGLVLDCYRSTPQRLELQSKAESENK